MSKGSREGEEKMQELAVASGFMNFLRERKKKCFHS